MKSAAPHIWIPHSLGQIKKSNVAPELWAELHIEERIERTCVHGHPVHRVPGTLNVAFEDVEGEALLIALDLKGIAVATGAACSSDSHEPSHVLAAMGCSPYLASCSIRFSLGRGTTGAQIDEVGRVLPEIISRLRAV